MENFKGTKGKWSVDPNFGFNEFDVCYLAIDSISYDERFESGQQEIMNVFGKDENDIEMKANALLISKAPEMLEMLSLIADVLQDAGKYEFQKRVENLIKEATEL